MPAYPRAELEEMVERWLEANRRGEAKKDWRHMADLYTEDATYGWNVGPNDEFMAVGRERDPRDRARAGDGGARGVDLPLPEGAHRRAAGRGPRSVEAGGRRQPGPTAPTTRSPGSAAAGSATPATSSGRWQRDFFDVGQRRRRLHGDDQGRHAAPRHAAADGARHVRRAPARATTRLGEAPVGPVGGARRGAYGTRGRPTRGVSARGSCEAMRVDRRRVEPPRPTDRPERRAHGDEHTLQGERAGASEAPTADVGEAQRRPVTAGLPAVLRHHRPPPPGADTSAGRRAPAIDRSCPYHDRATAGRETNHPPRSRCSSRPR